MTRVLTLQRHQLDAEIERHLDLGSDDAVVLIEGEDYLLVKKTFSVAPGDRFRQLCRETEARFQETGVTPQDVEDAVRWARESS